MQKLKQLVDSHQANTRPVDTASIQNLERKMGFALSDEYKRYLLTFGVIVFDAYETYGLGVPDDYSLNVFIAFSALGRTHNYPNNPVPQIGRPDGRAECASP